jgi:hypothetical protein
MVKALSNLIWSDAPRPVRRRDTRFLLLAVLLGSFCAALFGVVLYLLNDQMRI